MDFDYQQFVRKNFRYQKFSWPPDVNLAELHNRCSEPGLQLQSSALCPCCQRRIKVPFRSWLKRDIFQDFKVKGAAIYGYFALLVFYLVSMTLVFCINNIYQTVLTFQVCGNVQLRTNCTSLGSLPFISFDALYYSVSNQQRSSLAALQTVAFYILLIANNLSIVLIGRIKDKQYKQQSIIKNFAVILNNFEFFTKESIVQYLTLINNGETPQIVEIVPLRQAAHFNKIYKERYELYFKIKSKRLQCQDPLTFSKLIKQFQKVQQSFQEAQLKFNMKAKKAIVVFNKHQQARKLKSLLHINFIKKNYYLLRIFLHQKLAFKQISVDVYSQSVKEPRQIKWENIGERGVVKLSARIKTTLISMILMAIIYASLFFSLINSYNKKGSQMNLLQKLLSVLVSIGTISISIIYRVYMGKLAEQRCPNTEMSKSIFILITTVMFHILIYLIIPTIFYVIPDGIPQSTKLYQISQQARIFVYIQVLFSLIDWTHYLWDNKKNKLLANSKLINQMCQVTINQTVDCPQYPLQQKMMSLFKIWSLSLFYGFFQPYVMLTMIVGVFIIYILEKRNLYKHYNIKRYKSVEIQYKFLKIYIYFFCGYLCFIYSLNVPNSWQLILAIVSTVLSLLAQILYQLYYKEVTSNYPNLDTLKTDQSYQKLYQKFIESYQNDQLCQQINQFNRLVSKYIIEKDQQVQEKTVELELIQHDINTVIE